MSQNPNSENLNSIDLINDEPVDIFSSLVNNKAEHVINPTSEIAYSIGEYIDVARLELLGSTQNDR
jgi:hypothetical protein